MGLVPQRYQRGGVASALPHDGAAGDDGGDLGALGPGFSQALVAHAGAGALQGGEYDLGVGGDRFGVDLILGGHAKG